MSASIDLGFGTSVLVIDDTPSVLSMIRDLLEARNLQVRTAATVEDGLAYIEDHSRPLDLLVLDVMLAPLTGPEIARRAREVRPEVGLLYVSGHQRSELISSGHLDPDDIYQRKPFRFDELIGACKRALDERPQAS